MKITSIKTYILKVPLGEKRFYSSQCAFPERNSLIVKIETDEGVVGWGEGGQYGPPEPVKACIDSVFAPKLINCDPRENEVLWEKMYTATRDFGQKGSYIEAMSALDIAFWDIKGKAAGQPIRSIIGGAFRDRINTYATGCYYRGEDYLDYKSSLEELAREAKSYIDAGFKTIKIKVGLLSIEQDIERVREIRRAIGPDAVLLVDCNHAYNAITAIRMGEKLSEYNVRWMEEPVPPEDLKGYKKVRETISIPVAGGECEYTRYGFKSLITDGCVDIAQPDLCVCGGITECIKIQALATCYGVWVIPHVWGSGIALAAALQFVSTLPLAPYTANPIVLQNEPVVEYDQNYNPLRDDLLIEKIKIENGRILLNDNPGLGYFIDEDVLKRYAVTY